MQNAIFFFRNRFCKVQIAVFACKCVLRFVNRSPNPGFRNIAFLHHIKGVFGEIIIGHGKFILAYNVLTTTFVSNTYLPRLAIEDGLQNFSG